MNLQKVLTDLHGGTDEVKNLALNILLKVPGDRLLADQEAFKKLCFLSDESSRRSEGSLRDLYSQLRDKLEALRHRAVREANDPTHVDLSALGRGDPSMQIQTLQKIRAVKLGKALGEVRALLDVGAVDRVFAVAIETLGAVGDASDLPRVQTALSHAAGRVRAEAVSAFPLIAPRPQTIITMGLALGDRHPLVRRNGIRALARIGAASLIEHLQGMVSDQSPEVRKQALPLLGYLRGEVVLEMVRKLAADPSDAVRLEVVNILRAHGGKTVASTMEWLVQDQDAKVRAHAARGLALLKAGRGAKPGVDLATLDSVPTESPALDIPELAAMEPKAAIEALMRVKLAAPVEAYDPVCQLLEREDARVEVIASALSALSVLGGREDVQRVRPFLAHADGRVRANAVEAIEIMGGRKEILTWLTPMLADPIPRVKANVLLALGRFGEGVFLQHLQRMVLSTHVPVRISGVYALAHYPSPAAKALAQQVLQDKANEVRINFAEALAGKPDAWTREILDAMQKSDPNPNVRAAAKVSLEAKVSAPGPAADEAAAGPSFAGSGWGGQAAAIPGLSTGKTGKQPAVGPSVGASKPPAPPTPGPGPAPAAPPKAPGPEPVYTMVDGLPMCPAPELPPPSTRLPGSSASPDDSAARFEEFRPSIEVATDEVLGIAQAAAAELGVAPTPIGAPPAPPGSGVRVAAGIEIPEGGLPAPSAQPQPAEAVSEAGAPVEDPGSGTDALGRTFMNLAALMSPGKMASLKKVQELEKQRSEALEKLGRALYDRIERGELKNPGFDRTLFVIKKYVHSQKQKDGKGDTDQGSWFGRLMGAAGAAPEKAPEPAQLKAQFRNLAKDALGLLEAGQIQLGELDKLVKPIQEIDTQIKSVSGG